MPTTQPSIDQVELARQTALAHHALNVFGLKILMVMLPLFAFAFLLRMLRMRFERRR